MTKAMCRVYYKEYYMFFIEFMGVNPAPWDKENYKECSVYIMNLNNRLLKTFSYWKSKSSSEEIVEDDLINAIECILNDGLYGGYDIDELRESLGIEKCSELMRVHRACKKSRSDLEELGIDENKIYEWLEKGVENIISTKQ